MKHLIESHSKHIFLKPGELVTTAEDLLVNTVLGSCVAVTFYSKKSKFSGICHAMLPKSKDGIADFRYVDSALIHLYQSMLAYKAVSDIEVKIFGGANVLDFSEGCSTKLTIGEQNIIAAEMLLTDLGLQIVAKDIGGLCGRKLFFCTRTGAIYLKKVRRTVGGTS